MTGKISRWGKKQKKKTSEEKSRWGKKQILQILLLTKFGFILAQSFILGWVGLKPDPRFDPRFDPTQAEQLF